MDAANAVGWDCHVHVFDGEPLSRPGHYAPPRRTLDMLADAAAATGAGRFVLVQPSVYGSDNRLLLQALRDGQGLHRGVVVLNEAAGAAALEAMHELGVRGVRCNLVSPVGNSPAALEQLAPRLRELGWHVQWYAPASALTEVAAFQARHRLPCVLDHLASLSAAQVDNADAWAALRRVADGGGWIKLSGWYRLGATAPYEPLDDTLRRAADIFGPHCVWGSDWPHTMFLERGADAQAPDYAQTWAPVSRALGPTRANAVLRTHAAGLYR